MSFSGVRSILRNSSYLAASNALTAVLRGVYAVLLAIFLGPKFYGILNYSISWYLAFLPLTYLGMDAILGREVGSDRARGPNVVSETLSLRIAVSVGASISCAITGWITEAAMDVQILLIVFSLALCGRTLSLWCNGVFTAFEATRYLFILSAVFRGLEVALGLLAVVLGKGILILAIVHAFCWWCSFLCGLFLIKRKIVSFKLSMSPRSLWPWVLQGIPLGFYSCLIGWLMNGPMVLFRHASGNENELGQLALTMQAFVFASAVPLAMVGPSLPVLSRSVGRKDGKDQWFAEGMLRIGLVFGAIMGLAGWSVGPWLVNILFGPKYQETGRLLGVVFWLIIPLIWGSSLFQTQLARGHVLRPLIGAAGGAVVMTLTVPPLAHAFGIEGVLIGIGSGLTVWAGWLLCLCYVQQGMDLENAIIKPGLIVLSATGIYALLDPNCSWVGLIVSYGVLLIGLLALKAFSPNERALLLELVGKIKR